MYEAGRPNTARRPKGVVLEGPPGRKRHLTVVSALEAGARDGAPLLTFHTSREPRSADARSILEGSARAAAALSRAGVSPGTPLPILLPTSEALVHAILGAMIHGAIPAPLASPMTFGAVDRYVQNLRAVLLDCGATAVVTDDRVAGALAGDEVLRDRIRTVLGPEDLDAPSGARAPRRSVHPDDLALIQYTSGTTGDPKGVAITHRALTANAAGIASSLGLRDDDIGVGWLPLHHDMGLIGVLMTAVCHPYPVHVMRPEAFIMQPRRWLSLIARTGATLSVGPNFAYELSVRRAPEIDGSLSRWRIALDGAEPVHRATLERFRATYRHTGLRDEALTPAYGMAESTLAVTMCDPAGEPRVLEVDRESLAASGRVKSAGARSTRSVVSVGRPVAGTRVIVADGAGEPLGEGRVGEVRVRGESVMAGYYHRPDATERAFADGWLRTGDRGFVADGELFVVGRDKDVIIVAGRNYYPYDIERVASETDGVVGAVAIGVSDAERGTERLELVVEARTADDAKRERIAKDVRGSLLAASGIKAERVHVWAPGAIPRTTSGKIRRPLAARALEEGGR